MKEKKKNCATCEARTHDLQIMRLTRCRLRQGGTCTLMPGLLILYVAAMNISASFVQEKPPMDLFKAIFAESSSESEKSDMENEQSQENQATTMVAEQSILTQRATLEGGGTTKWQDLSLVSTRIPVRNTPVPSRWDPETTPVTLSKRPDEGCATNRHVENVMRTQDRVVTESQMSTAESFGPALPPGV